MASDSEKAPCPKQHRKANLHENGGEDGKPFDHSVVYRNQAFMVEVKTDAVYAADDGNRDDETESGKDGFPEFVVFEKTCAPKGKTLRADDRPEEGVEKAEIEMFRGIAVGE